MKAEIATKRANFPGNGDKPQVAVDPVKQWRQKLGYCSLFAALPGLVASQSSDSTTSKARETNPTVSEPERISRSHGIRFSTPALMRLQSKFLLPHQRGNFNMFAMFGGGDNCPGIAIPGGNYTAASPYTDSGDTTGANNTINRVFYLNYWYYYNWDAFGPDHVYSFTLTGRGPNPKIQVTTTSNTYRPMIYVLHGLGQGGCPSGTGNEALNELIVSDSRWSGGNVAELGDWAVNYLPLNVPLYLVVDSSVSNDAGPYTIKMQDVTVAPASCSSPFACPEMFVRQHYLDFLNRVADPSGLAYWTDQLTDCGSNMDCTEARKIHVSAAFFLSIEFQESGYLVYRMYKAAYGDIPGTPMPLTRQEFLPDTQRVGIDVIVGASNWKQILENNKKSFANEFVQRFRFTNAFPFSLSADQFVDILNRNTGNVVSPAKRDQLVNDLRVGAKTRAEVLRAVAEDPDFARSEFNKAFVLMQYFGYLRRNPNDSPDRDFSGYDFWLDKLNHFNGDFVEAQMVKAFIDSDEYRRRFGQ